MPFNKTIKSPVGEFTLSMRDATLEELDSHNLEMGKLPVLQDDPDKLVEAQIKARVRFFDLLHLESSITKDKIPQHVKASLVFRQYEYWEAVDEKN